MTHASRRSLAAEWVKPVAGLAAVLLVGSSVVPARLATAAGRPARLPVAQKSFLDPLDLYDTKRWVKADGWVNGPPFANAWLADHVTHGSGKMTLRLDNYAYLGMPYTSGEIRTKGFYGYGCYEARFKPVRQAGVITSFFTFAGPYDNGGNGRHNEIDIEFAGDGNSVQFNFWTNDDTYQTNNAWVLPLPFDPSQAMHSYAFRWTSKGIDWFVDRALVYGVTDSPSNPTPKATQSLQKIMMNVWPVDDTAAPWAGYFSYAGPLRPEYESVRYTQGETCTPSL